MDKNDALMVCGHIKKGKPALEINFPHLICRVCTRRMDESQNAEEAVKDIFVACPDCVSKEIRDRSFWKDWYEVALKHFKSLGYDSIPSMEDTELLKGEPPMFNKCECGVCKQDINKVKDPGKPDEEGCYIKQYFHCKSCMAIKPESKSPSQWARIAVGFTAKGIEAWCVRCHASIINFDFQGRNPVTI